MTTLTSKIDLLAHFGPLGTRASGAEARTMLLSELSRFGRVEVNLGFGTITPSFADECIGILAAQLGREQFKERVSIKNVSPQVRPLLLQVIQARLSPRGERAA